MKRKIFKKLCAVFLSAITIGAGITGAVPFIDVSTQVSAVDSETVYVNDLKIAVHYKTNYAEVIRYVGSETAVSVPGSYKFCWIDNICLDSTSIRRVTLSSSYSGKMWSFACPNLKEIRIESGNSKYSSYDGVVFNKKRTELIYCPPAKSGDFVIPDGVTSIREGAFSGCSLLTSVTFPDSVTSIGSNAFRDCSGLSVIDLPDKLTSIGEYAFSGCSSLSQISIPESVDTISGYAFSGCKSLSSVTIPSRIMKISDGLFSRCSSLKEVTLPDGVASIGRESFLGCSSMTSISLPDNVEAIYDGAFSSCSKLTDVVIPEKTLRIYDKAFANCTSLESVVFGRSVTYIGGSYYNSSTTSSANNQFYDPFFGCHALKKVLMPESVDLINKYVFTNVDKNEFVIYCEPDSYVSDWAANKGFRTADIEFENVSVVSKKEIMEGDSIRIKCMAQGGNKPYLYAVYYRKAGAADWNILQAYMENTNLEFTPDKPGQYEIRVNVADDNGDIARKMFTVEVSKYPDIETELEASIGKDSIFLGESVDIAYNAEGTSETYEYAVYCKTEDDENWTLLSDFSGKKNCSFTPGKVGNYTIRVDSRDTAGGIVSKELSLNVNMSLTNTSVLNSETITLGSKVKVRCFAKGGVEGYQYAVFYKKSSSKVWTRASAYSTKNIIILTPKSAVLYDIRVDIKDSEGTVASKQLKLTVEKELENTSKLGAESIVLGEKVKVRCFATGGSGNYQFAIYYKKETSSNWSKLREFGTDNIVMLKPGAAVPYDVRVDVKDERGTVVSKILKLAVTK